MAKKMGVGSELDSYCGRCKLVLNHTVVAMVEAQPRRVRCLTCQSEHNHRITTSKTKTTRSSGSKRTRTPAPNQWQIVMAEWDGDAAKSYSIYETFQVDDWVSHVKFGNGKVIDVPSPDRMITLFEVGEKMLMQGKQKG